MAENYIMDKKEKRKLAETSDATEKQDVLSDELSIENLGLGSASENSEVCESDGQDELNRKLDQETLATNKKTITAEKLKEFNAKIEKTGIVYISRIPPRMAPRKLRRLLSRFKAEVGRIYFSAEDPYLRKKRRINGGTRQKLYTEGWIEFMDKNKAKTLVKMINNTQMDPKKRSYHHEDLWNLKYLPKFKWSHLTERIAYEKQVRTKKLQAEVALSKKINQQYISKVEKAKMIQKMEDKKLSQAQEEGQPPIKVLRRFPQKETIFSETKPKDPNVKDPTDGPKDRKMTSVLSKIFG